MKKRKVVWKVIALSALIILLLLMIGFVIYLERYQPEEVLLEINNTVPSTEAAPALDTVQPPYSIAETEVQSPSTTEATVPAAACSGWSARQRAGSFSRIPTGRNTDKRNTGPHIRPRDCHRSPWPDGTG